MHQGHGSSNNKGEPNYSPKTIFKKNSEQLIKQNKSQKNSSHITGHRLVNMHEKVNRTGTPISQGKSLNKS